MQAYFSEFIGTLILILLGNGVVANVVLRKTKGNSSGWIVITAGWGFAVAIAAYITGWMGSSSKSSSNYCTSFIRFIRMESSTRIHHQPNVRGNGWNACCLS